MINWGYFIVFEFVSGGRTIGKRVIGIRVIQDNGHSITFLSSLIRNLLRVIDSLPTSYLLGMIMIFSIRSINESVTSSQGRSSFMKEK
ncbi:RDD family protein [Bacillus sp. N9]